MTDRLNKLAAAVDAYGIMAQDNDLLEAAIASLAEKQRAIDAAFATLDAGHGMLACRDASHILRPHATEATEGQISTAAHYTRAEAKANVDAIINKVTEAKQPRQWTSTPPKDRSRKWWNAYGVSAAHAHYRHIIPDECSWDNATHLVAESDYDLWLPWHEGDTKDNLPPPPTEATPVTTQPTAVVTPVGSGTTQQVSPVGNDDTRELVARLAECVRNINPVDATLGAIIAAARRGGGA